MLQAVWNLDYADNVSAMPFAGSKQKVLAVDPKQKFMKDNYKSQYG